MGRLGMITKLGATLCAAVLALSATAGDADAAKKKRKPKPAAAAAPAPLTTGANAKALGELMGPFKFGMAAKDVLKVLSKQIDEKYAEQIKNTEDVYKQDQLRKDKQAELDRIKKTFVEFKGTKTGWDVSIIDQEFAHDTGEAMMMFWENDPGSGKDQRRFFFFQDGKLYKMFIALNSSAMKGEQLQFAYFKGLMEKRYGAGRALGPSDAPTGVEWRTRDHHVRALDKLDFHGSFCLVIGDPADEARIAELRAQKKTAPSRNGVLDAVKGSGKDDETPTLDENKAGVDAILKD
jgi:hypothetical protein